MFYNIIELLFMAALAYDMFTAITLRGELSKLVGGSRDKLLMHIGLANDRKEAYLEKDKTLRSQLLVINVVEISALVMVVLTFIFGGALILFEAVFVGLMLWEYVLLKQYPEASLYEQIRNEIKRVIEEDNESN
jgi:hypothetical protein